MERKNRFAVPPKQAELSAHADGQGAAADQAHKLGLSYYGFGRYGKQGKVTHHTVNGKLVEVPKEKPGEVSVPTTGSSMKKIQEAAYTGNIGMMEVMKFHQKATPEQKKEFKSHMANNKHGDAWKLIQDVSGVKLVGKEFESNDKYVTDKNGNPRMFMLRRNAAKEAHTKDGEVVQQGKGYVVKLKENKNDEIFQRTIESQTIGTRTSFTEAFGGSGGVSRASGRNTSSGSSSGRCATCGKINEDCGCETNSTKKLTLSKIRERQAEKIKESIDKGIEPGLSMAASGESIGRDMGEKIKKRTGKASQVVEMQGDETGASIGAQKEDELKKKGISLLSFKSNKAIGA
jgi:hypothetical protein